MTRISGTGGLEWTTGGIWVSRSVGGTNFEFVLEFEDAIEKETENRQKWAGIGRSDNGEMGGTRRTLARC